MEKLISEMFGFVLVAVLMILLFISGALFYHVQQYNQFKNQCIEVVQRTGEMESGRNGGVQGYLDNIARRYYSGYSNPNQKSNSSSNKGNSKSKQPTYQADFSVEPAYEHFSGTYNKGHNGKYVKASDGKYVQLASGRYIKAPKPAERYGKNHNLICLSSPQNYGHKVQFYIVPHIAITLNQNPGSMFGFKTGQHITAGKKLITVVSQVRNNSQGNKDTSMD